MFGKKHATPEGLQRAFVAALVVAYGIGLVQTVNIFYQQALSNPNFSGMWPMLLWQAMPPAFFALAYLLSPRKKLPSVQRVFEAVLIAVTGLAVFTIVSLVASYTSSVASWVGETGYLLYELSIMAAMVAGFAAVLWYLARSKRWK